MKTTNSLFSPISKTEVKNLVKEVKETLVTVYNQSKTFSAAELWNIQRRGRTSIQRRRFA